MKREKKERAETDRGEAKHPHSAPAGARSAARSSLRSNCLGVFGGDSFSSGRHLPFPASPIVAGEHEAESPFTASSQPDLGSSS